MVLPASKAVDPLCLCWTVQLYKLRVSHPTPVTRLFPTASCSWSCTSSSPPHPLLLQLADPEDACQPLTNRYDDEPWVALISRSQHVHPTNCTFDVKVGWVGRWLRTSSIGGVCVL